MIETNNEAWGFNGTITHAAMFKKLQAEAFDAVASAVAEQLLDGGK